MLTILEHPLITHKLAQMRNKETSTKDFRDNVDEIAGLMTYEVTRTLPVKEVCVQTPIEQCTTFELSQDIILVPILRAGLGMVSGFLHLISGAKVAHVGLYRDEDTLQPHVYFEKYPTTMARSVVIIVDPMLASGGSAVAAIDMVKKQGACDIRLACIVGAPEGVRAVEDAHPDVDIYLAALDTRLNDKGYIVPGLGDAGDRIFGTQ